MLVIFSLALGTAIGCFVRRTIPAMTTAFVLFLIAYLALTNWYTYLTPPQTYTFNYNGTYPQALLENGVLIKWVCIDRQGNEIKNLDTYCHFSSPPSKEIDACMASTQEKITYQPPESFWPLQWIVSGILPVLSLGLGVVIFIRVRSSVD